MKNVFILTLGCPKNTVDSENIMYILKQQGYTIVDDATISDFIIINTCTFIHDAMEESINAILEATLVKKDRDEVKIIVTGCLAQRYADELIKEIPEVDAFIGTGEFYNMDKIIKNMEEKQSKETIVKTDNIDCPIFETDRTLTTPSHYAYIKVSEGCDKHCTYCVIPSIRGKQRSRKLEDIMSEAKRLAHRGVKEIILIAQDVGEYGIDLYGKRELPKLLEELNKIEGIKWIRVLYIYPETISDELIDKIAKIDKVVKYIDMPLQHINNDILKKMGRKTSKEDILNLIRKLRSKIKDIKIRSTFITGFPSETELQHKELLEFIELYQLDRVGFFKYSREEGTPAYKIKPQIDEDTKEKRYTELMQAQEAVSEELMESYIDKTLEVLVEEKVEGEDKVYIGRSYMDCPEIDGEVYIYSDKYLEIGNFYDIVIEDSMEYDLIGRTK
ncbi:30S ribosomal protein S12 methylthiotransferase RimO [Anaerofustis sp.]|uniref:30S ribosomal protein S12 methylthiotransferase RimO n=1 Tax=Anaerofustis sp. TaxID=1872517 RepID=UPI0025C5D00A|nr:30S ribosomal protein S12 methylthiotransferase RimO [Anaerofustis sp.]